MDPCPVGVCAGKTWPFSSACKILGAQHPLGPKYGLPKKSIWIGTISPLINSVISGPKFTELFSPNAGGIAVQNLLVRFWISSSIPEIFAAKLWSRPKSGQILHVLAPRPKLFWGMPAKFLDQHYKTGPSTDHRAKFRGWENISRVICGVSGPKFTKFFYSTRD